MNLKAKTEKKIIVFDFDLTLADATKGIYECVNYAMKKMEQNTFGFDAVKSQIGYSLQETYKRLTGDKDQVKAEQFFLFFKEHADKIMNINTFLYPEVYEIIPLLKKTGFKTGIVSTKFRYRIAGVLDRENLLTCFDIIIGGEDVKHHKPNPEGLLLAIEKSGFSNAETLYIGDSMVDAETAASAGVDFLAVLSGTTTKADFLSRNCDSINNLNEIFIYLEQHKIIPGSTRFP